MHKTILISSVALIICSFISLFIGVAQLNFGEIMNGSRFDWQLLFLSRIPRLLSILMAGAGMSIAGLIMQQITQNRFVSPTTAGTMDFAMLGIVFVMIFFSQASVLIKIGFAFCFSFLGSLLFIKILDQIRVKDIIFIPLIGIMLGNVVSGVSIFLALRFNLMQSISGWLQGDFSMITKGQYEILFLTLPSFALAYIFANRFTLAGMGPEFATSLGLSHKKIMRIGLLIVSVITSSVILTVGVIPFLGLIIPNLVSLFFGDNLKSTLPLTAIFGALFVLIADILGRLIISPYEIPISLMVGTFGCAIFLILLFKQQYDRQV